MPSNPPVKTSDADELFKATVVSTIIDFKPEIALGILSRFYRVGEPRIRVGAFKGRSRGVRAVYSANRREILVAKREYLYDPFTILHEFYHHLRQFDHEHRGTEKHADKFALDFVEAYGRVVSRVSAAERKGRSAPTSWSSPPTES